MQLEIKDLKIGYGPKGILLDNYNEILQSGNLVAVIGRNGSGKSTFLKHLAGLSRSISGEILLNKKNTIEISPIDLAKKISWIGTDKLNYLYLSIEELVGLGRHPHLGFGGFMAEEDWKIVHQALDSLNIGHLKKKSLSECSDGEKQSAMLARAIAQNTEIMLLDEITAHLDYVHRHKSFAFLNKLTKEQNKLILIATHEIDLALRYCDIILIMNHGKIQRILKKDLEDKKILQELFGDIDF